MSESPKSRPPPRAMTWTAKRPQNSPLERVYQWLFDNQASLSFQAIAPFLLAHVCVPAMRPFTDPLFGLSYHNPQTGRYSAGFRDLCFVAFCIALCIGVRAFLMRRVLVPLGRACGVTKQKDLTRFSEQGWMLAYYSATWPLGMSPYFLNLEELWTGWPQKELDGPMKVYVLVQWAYWIQQVIVVNIEARRKDYKEMIIHHAITTSLIASAYAYYQTRAGHLILVLMDAVELIFPLAKCLKYIGFTTVCDVVFGVFVVVWVMTRHVFYLMICWSVYRDLPRIVAVPCYRGTAGDLQGPFPAPKEGWSHLLEPFYDPTGMVCFTNGIRTAFLVFLLALELVICVWTFFILRVSVRVLKGGNAEDVRSDDEAEAKAETEEQSEYEEIEPLEQEVGVEAIDLTAARRRNALHKSGLRLSSPSGRKEILNRIGCEKQID
ncbi:longevity-assurance protein [Grosmannia clavigera kw1407]|uniref:Longevity-assurance protein n=1 Tax=Grosmannia clavigera (strain kw1407 / UAMH 11150) TaxID=655863 RepID=F0XDS9_GROCL|nr:longevity-assurance protein [Grosmannia clavigera kw1407]EFX04155.1 longevity-assurance protein [Grosmannia clavigera kw1407]